MPTDQHIMLAYQIQASKHFDYFITLCIFFSIILMSVDHYKIGPDERYYIQLGHRVLMAVYNVEALLKILALKKDYFSNGWNQLDFFIVLMVDLTLLLELVNTTGMQFENKKILADIINLIKSVRILRVLRLIRISKNLSMLFDSLGNILPQIANVASLILLMFFIFSVIGMNMFSDVIHQFELNENNNFSNFGTSLILLIRCATGERWNFVMRELAVTNDKLQSHVNYYDFEILKHKFNDLENLECIENQSLESKLLDGPKECGTQMSYVYFILFIVIIQIMMLNLFTAVVLEGFSSSNKEHTGTVTSEHYNELITHWQTYDKSGSGWITLRDLIFLLFELNAPFGFNNEYIKF